MRWRRAPLVLLLLGACTATSSTTTTVNQVFGWVTFVETGPDAYTLEVDEAEFLTGAAAISAAAEDGAESPPPNDFYIRNRETSLTAYRLDPLAAVTLNGEVPGSGTGITTFTASVAEWSAWTAGESAPLGWNWYGQAVLPYWLTVEDDLIVAVTEQYLP